jgi:hypothetical protein
MMVFNMLNTRYFIRRNPTTGQPEALLNPGAFGPVWFAKKILWVTTADEEMKALDSVNVRDTAIVRKNYADAVPFQPVFDTTATIKLIENRNDRINYSFSAKTNQFAVFSEVYYNKGWNAYLDGRKTPYVRTNYILRGMAVPAGSHTIEFRFEPTTYRTGEMISWISSILAYLLFFAAIWYLWKQFRKPADKVSSSQGQS